MRISSFTASLAALGVAVGLVVVPAAPVVAAPAAVPDEAPTEGAALTAARHGKKSVRVLDQTDEFSEVRANPDGSMTMTQHLRPVRVKQAGKWTPVDMTLARRADGTIAPRASYVEVTLSGGGGKAPIVKVGKDATEVGLGWPEALPEPRLDGPTATYPEVMPGVDLKVTADETGFSQVLVLKTPQAARNPRLRQVSFGSYTKNAKVKAVDGLQAGENGPVFKGTASRMWDSSGDASPQDRLTGNGEGTRSATMGVRVSDAAVAIEPDQAFMAAPDTKFPVYLDPSYRCTNCGKAHHLVVQSEWPGAQNFDRTDGALGDLKAGYVCENGKCFISRTYLRMNTGALAGRAVSNAYLHLDTINSYHCGGAATTTELYSSNWFDAGSVWNNQPGFRLFQSGGYSCTGGGLDLGATQAMQEAAANGWGETPLALKGRFEGDNTSWRRFGLNPYLVVDYNSYPNQPSDLGIEGWGPNGGDALGCRLGAGRSFVGKSNPRLRARVSDPDGGMLDAGFRVYKGAFQTGGQVDEKTVGNIPSGSFAESKTSALPDGVYNWGMWGSDGALLGWSPFCEMEIDTKPPGMPVVTSADYPENKESGGIGRNGLFQFKAPTGTIDIAYYLYSFSSRDGDDPQTKVTPAALNGSAQVSWTPLVSGPEYLSVRAVDRAGNRSPIYPYRIDVADYQVGVSGKVAHWSFNDSLQDTSNAKSLTYTGPPPPGGFFGAGQQGRAVLMGAENREYYQARDALVRTDSSFTVSAWVKLAADNDVFTVASQDGDISSGMKLRYDNSVHSWVLSLRTGATTEVKVQSTQPPAVDTWTYLTAVYDSVGKKARIFVNGVSAGEVDVPVTPLNTTGPFAVGASKTDNERSQYFTGSIDTLRAYTRALSTTEITALVNGTSSAGPDAEYLFEDNLVNTGANNNLAAASTVYDTAGFAGKALKLDSASTIRPTTAAPVVTTTDSFSVSAWVKLNDKAGHYTVAGQDGSATSGFVIRYAQDVDRWVFGLASADQAGEPTQWVTSTTSPVAKEWTHITAVHDTSAHRIFLYLNGVRVNDREVASTFRATGPFVIGASKSGNTRPGLMSGLIDEVDVYDGALTPAEVAQVANTPFEKGRFKLEETAGSTAADATGLVAAAVYGTGITWGVANGKPAASFSGQPDGTSPVVAGAEAEARWNLDNALTDGSGHGRDLQHWKAAAQTAPTYAGGYPGGAVSLNGTDTSLSSASQVLHTSTSFSVSAKVNLTSTANQATIVAQDGGVNSPFMLQYNKTDNKWAFTLVAGDTANAGTVRATSALPPRLGVWTHLLGVYDQQAAKARLYVNGFLESEITVSAVWPATGSLTVGRAKRNSQPADFLPGAVDEVRAYDRVLTATDAHNLWNPMRDINAPFDQSFRADRSFTVSTWARLDSDNQVRAALSFGGNQEFSPFVMGYWPEWKRWRVVAMTQTGTDPLAKTILSDNEAPTYADPDGWVHLAATYDAPNKRIQFYVNGIPQSTVPLDATRVVKVDPASPPSSYAGAGMTIPDRGRNLLIGRSTWTGLSTAAWKGALRDIRVFTGVLPGACDRDTPVCLTELARNVN